jgi:hypothetical protein
LKAKRAKTSEINETPKNINLILLERKLCFDVSKGFLAIKAVINPKATIIEFGIKAKNDNGMSAKKSADKKRFRTNPVHAPTNMNPRYSALK